MSRKKNKPEGGGGGHMLDMQGVHKFFLRVARNGRGLSLYLPASLQKAAGIGYGSVLTALVKTGELKLLVLDPADQQNAALWPRGFFNCDLSGVPKAEPRKDGGR